MDTNPTIKKPASNLWLFVATGSAIGGAVGYLLGTESGRKVRETISNPDEWVNNIKEARNFIEDKTRTMTNQIKGVERGIQAVLGTDQEETAPTETSGMEKEKIG